MNWLQFLNGNERDRYAFEDLAFKDFAFKSQKMCEEKMVVEEFVIDAHHGVIRWGRDK